MPEFDPNKLSAPERAAWIDRLKGDGPKEVAVGGDIAHFTAARRNLV